MKNKIKNFARGIGKKHIFSVLLLTLVVFIFPFFVSSAKAADGIADSLLAAVASVMGSIVYLLVAFVVGPILTIMLSILVFVAQYNNFIEADSVRIGWAIIRDLCNMFFVLILLVIAFATILKIENYKMKSMLPKLLIMAVLINFSKTICGIIIDFSQIIMLTFVKGFAVGGAGRFIQLLQIDKYMAFGGYAKSQSIGFSETAGAIIAGLIAAIISLIVVTVLLFVLVMRVVMLWIYVVLSPVAFFASILPQTQKYSSQWWSEFMKNVIVGPVLAFFIWLALSTAQVSSTQLMGGQDVIEKANKECGGANALFCGGDLQTYIMTIAFLVGGLIVTQQIGGAAGGIAGKGLSAIQKGKSWATGLASGAATGAGAWAGKKAWGATKTTGNLARAVAGTLDRKLAKSVGAKSLEGSGLVAGGAMAISRGVGEKFNKIKDRIAGDREEKKELHKFRMNKQAGVDAKDNKIKIGGREYQHHEGRFREVDEKGQFVKDSYAKNKYGKEVKEMSDLEASAYESFSNAFGVSRGVANKAQEEKVGEHQKRFTEADTSSSELRQKIDNAALSKEEKIAASMTLAERGDFGNKEEVEAARNIVKSNPLLLGKFKDDVDKKQAHLAYDLEDAGDRKEFQKRIENGKIDLRKLPAKAYEATGFISAVKEHFDDNDEFDSIMSSVYNNGTKAQRASLKKSFEKEKEKISTEISVGGKGFESKVDIKVRSMIAEDKTGKTKDDDSTRAKAKESVTAALNKDKINISELHAKLTGDVESAFRGENGNIDTAALTDYIKKAKPKDLAKIDVGKYKDMDDDIKNAIIAGMSAAKLQQLSRIGENDALVRDIGGGMIKNNHPDKKSILSNKILVSAAGGNYTSSDKFNITNLMKDHKKDDESYDTASIIEEIKNTEARDLAKINPKEFENLDNSIQKAIIKGLDYDKLKEMSDTKNIKQRAAAEFFARKVVDAGGEDADFIKRDEDLLPKSKIKIASR